jgi:hypothetical protein
VDDIATADSLERLGAARARLIHSAAVGSTGPAVRTNLLLGPVRIDRARGTRLREVVVDGWRIDVEMEFERRAVLRERARRGAGTASLVWPVEVRAIIPGRVVAVSEAAGDSVEAGPQVLVVEATRCRTTCGRPARARWSAWGLPLAIRSRPATSWS